MLWRASGCRRSLGEFSFREGLPRVGAAGNVSSSKLLWLELGPFRAGLFPPFLPMLSDAGCWGAEGNRLPHSPAFKAPAFPGPGPAPRSFEACLSLSSTGPSGVRGCECESPDPQCLFPLGRGWGLGACGSLLLHSPVNRTLGFRGSICSFKVEGK